MPIVLLTTSTVFSQTKALNSNGDTIIYFSVDKAKYLLKQTYKVKELTELNKVLKQEKKYCDSLQVSQQVQIDDQATIIKNDSIIVADKDLIIKNQQKDIKRYRHQVIKQKILKTGLYISNSVTLVVLIIKLL